MRQYLEFEKPVAELEAKIDELRRMPASGEINIAEEVARLSAKADAQLKGIYAKLTPWQKTQVARHAERPKAAGVIAALIEDFIPLAGDRAYGDDAAILSGLGRFRGLPVMVIGQEKGHDTTTRIKHNFGAARPEGYRKAVRLMDLAEQFNLPVLSFIDTGGAYPGIGGEERGVAEAIARGTERCLTLGTPMIATITGEGMSGGAIGIAAANKVLILEHAIYAVISPEGCASILLRDRTLAEGAAKAMKITAEDLIGLRIVDRVIEEPVGGAHADPALAISRVGDAIEAELRPLMSLSADALRDQRAQRFYAIGRA